MRIPCRCEPHPACKCWCIAARNDAIVRPMGPASGCPRFGYPQTCICCFRTVRTAMHFSSPKRCRLQRIDIANRAGSDPVGDAARHLGHSEGNVGEPY